MHHRPLKTIEFNNMESTKVNKIIADSLIKHETNTSIKRDFKRLIYTANPLKEQKLIEIAAEIDDIHLLTMSCNDKIEEKDITIDANNFSQKNIYQNPRNTTSKNNFVGKCITCNNQFNKMRKYHVHCSNCFYTKILPRYPKNNNNPTYNNNYNNNYRNNFTNPNNLRSPRNNNNLSNNNKNFNNTTSNLPNSNLNNTNNNNKSYANAIRKEEEQPTDEPTSNEVAAMINRPFDRPFINLDKTGKSRALIDTGANDNIVSSAYLRKRGIRYQSKPTECSTFQGYRAKLLGTAMVPLFRGQQPVKCAVTENMTSQDVILGTPWLKDIGVMDSFTNALNNTGDYQVTMGN